MKKILTLPLNEDDNNKLCELKIGDVFYLSGTIVTGRDEVYHRVTEENKLPPINLKGLASYHAGPIVSENNELISIGPTTSARMEKWAAEFIQKTGVKIMIGKGGMQDATTESCKTHKVIHCVYPGGCAVLGASLFEKIEECLWPEFGMAECMWVIKAKEFGPLIVSIDTEGGNLFKNNVEFYKKKII